MSCERYREQIPECLAGRLPNDVREDLIAHLEICSTCRADLAEIGVVWRGLDALPVVEPDPAAKARFMEVLEAYQTGMVQGQERAIKAGRPRWLGWWPAKPVWQSVIAATLLVAGFLGGRYLLQTRTVTPEMAQLHSELEGLRQQVALSMMQNQSPASRIRGVNFGAQVAQPDRDVTQALLYAVNHDSNINVRLSAVDALEKLAGNSEIQRALVDALPIQDSPLVEIALIDVLVAANDRSAVPALQQLASKTQTDESVRQRAAAAAKKLEDTK